MFVAETYCVLLESITCWACSALAGSKGVGARDQRGVAAASVVGETLVDVLAHMAIAGIPCVTNTVTVSLSN